MGAEGARQVLRAGANDLGGTLMDENISRAAGAQHGQRMGVEELEAIVAPLGRPLVQRSTLYAAGGRVTDESETEEAARQRAFDALADGHDLSPAQARELQDMIGSLGDLAREGTSVGDLKIANAALAEMAEAFRVFRPYRHIRKITMFGSARTKPDDPIYLLARDLAAKLAAADWMVVTGAGPGHHGRRPRGRGARPRLRGQHPAAPRGGRQPLHRPGPEAGRDALLLHPQADADQGVARLRHPPRAASAPRTRRSSC